MNQNNRWLRTIVFAALLLGAGTACGSRTGQTGRTEPRNEAARLSDRRPAGAVEQVTGPGGVLLRAKAYTLGPAPDVFQATVTAINPTEHLLKLLYGDSYAVDYLLYREGTGQGEAAWNSRHQRVEFNGGWHIPERMGTPLELPLRPGGMGADPTWTTIVPVRQILGDTLPEGRYRVVAKLAFEVWVGLEAGTRYPTDTLYLDAGSVVLRRR